MHHNQQRFLIPLLLTLELNAIYRHCSLFPRLRLCSCIVNCLQDWRERCTYRILPKTSPSNWQKWIKITLKWNKLCDHDCVCGESKWGSADCLIWCILILKGSSYCPHHFYLEGYGPTSRSKQAYLTPNQFKGWTPGVDVTTIQD